MGLKRGETIGCDRMGRGGEKGGPSLSGGVPEQGPAARRSWCRRRARARRRRRTGWTLGDARYVHGVWVKGLFGVCVCECATHFESLSLSLSLTHTLSPSLCRVLLQLLRTLSQCTDSLTHTHTHTQNHSNTRATCRHAALLEEALLRRAGYTPREHHHPPTHTHTKVHTRTRPRSPRVH